MNPEFLTSMAEQSRERVARARRDEPDAALQRRARRTPIAPRLRLVDFDVIAEIKRMAPSVAADPVAGELGDRARAYASAGAAAISVLTEPSRFGGSLADLRSVVQHAGDVPVMRKDFIVDPYQVLEARAAGAGGVLLICELLDDRMLAACLREAQAQRMFALVEAFDVRQVERARSHATSLGEPAPVFVGVNCRDLRSLSVDASRFEALAPTTSDAITIAESGLEDPRSVARVARLGYRGVLVGTALMRAPEPHALLAAMIDEGRRARCASV